MALEVLNDMDSQKSLTSLVSNDLYSACHEELGLRPHLHHFQRDVLPVVIDERCFETGCKFWMLKERTRSSVNVVCYKAKLYLVIAANKGKFACERFELGWC